MKQKLFNKNAERFPGKLSIGLFLIAIKSLPEIVLFPLAQLAGNLVFIFAVKRRKRAIDNLTTAFKDKKSPQEIKRMAKQAFCEIAQNGVEAAIIHIKNKDLKKSLTENISVEGAEYLDNALNNKQGIICVSAHFGNFMLLTLRLSLMDYPCSTVVKDSDNTAVAELWQDMRRKAGMKWIAARPRIKAVSGSMRWLRNGGILFLYADQNKNDGVYVDFFKRPAGTVEGPALFHLRTGAEILCAFIIRLDRKKHKIIITPPAAVRKTGNHEEDIYQVTQAYTKTIEEFIRRYPEQWWWPHKRWKLDR